MQTPMLRHWALLGYLVLAWGFAFYLIAIGLESLAPTTVVWARLFTGALVMLLIMKWRGGSLRLGQGWLLRLIILSVTGNILPFTLIAWAEQSVPSGQVGMLMALMPITTMLLAHYFLEQEFITPLRFVGVLLGLAGVALLVGGDVLQDALDTTLWGQLAAVLATFCYAANGIYAKRLPKYDVISVTAASLLTGSILLLPWVFLNQAPVELVMQWQSVVAVLALGILGTGLATWAYFTVVSECGPGFLATINYLIPGLAFLVGVFLLQEPAGWAEWCALALILSGVWMIQPRRRVGR
ncbi:DMT family transporter [Paraglaciecola sp.]|nr:DMT family transporter [Paraglaciecola sp.]MDB4281805.1 DMT family transporter [Paraglaciecola sp.]